MSSAELWSMAGLANLVFSHLPHTVLALSGISTVLLMLMGWGTDHA